MKSLEKNLMIDNLFSGGLIVLALSWALTAAASDFLASRSQNPQATTVVTHAASLPAPSAAAGRVPAGERA